jgi:hypothetical protein
VLREGGETTLKKSSQEDFKEENIKRAPFSWVRHFQANNMRKKRVVGAWHNTLPENNTTLSPTPLLVLLPNIHLL